MKTCLASVVLISCFVSSLYASSKFSPPAEHTILFVGQDVDSIRTYLKTVKTIPAGFMSYTSLENLEGLDSFHDQGGGAQHTQLLVNKYPDTAVQIGLYLVDQLEAVNNGAYDNRIDKLGEWIRSVHRPVFLRIGYEFDLPSNRYEPAKYILAFKHIVDRFRKNGVDNVAFVWHSYAQGSKQIMQWYPGDNYWDWVGASYFGQFPKFVREIADVSDKLKKPFMLAETSSWYIKNEAQREIFFKRLFQFIEDKNVDALCYINANWDAQPMWESQHYGDGRVQAYPAVFQLWLEETSKDRFIKSSPELFKTLQYQP